MKANRVKKVNVNLDITEYEDFIKAFQGTTCRSLSAYGRKLLLAKPVHIIYRNRSLDDFIELAVKLRKDFKILLAKDYLSPLEKETLQQKTNSIEENLINLVNLCSQK
ncbi:hypothetical protein [Puia sp.]|jgi:hypothetical protein|uniref:hypothetical protein n=1 Tax=Puia sp. TaxID=2045100 RepID=UPI002F40F891